MELSAKQEKALAYLLSQPTVKDAAQSAGIAVRTLYGWLHDDPQFEMAYREARRAVVAHAIARLQQSAGDAVTVLNTIMMSTAERGPTRIAAAKIILETALKAVEVEDLVVRVEILERMLNEKP